MSQDLFRQAATKCRTLFNAWLMLNSPFEGVAVATGEAVGLGS